MSLFSCSNGDEQCCRPLPAREEPPHRTEGEGNCLKWTSQFTIKSMRIGIWVELTRNVDNLVLT